MANEKRLIDANAFLKALNERPLDFLDVGGDFGYFDETIDSVMNEQPTVDAVEVCRCKDCKHFNHQKALRPGGIWCEYWGTDPDPDDFCSCGERRTE